MRGNPFEPTTEADARISIAAFKLQDQNVLALTCEHLTWKIHYCLLEIHRLRTQIDSAVSIIDDCAEKPAKADRLPQLVKQTLVQSHK